MIDPSDGPFELYAGTGSRQFGILMDVGAHIGVFTDLALRHGASKVIVVEPDPLYLECFRRNFAGEIRSGRVLLVEIGAWSSDATLPLSRGSLNSGSSRVIMHSGGWAGPTVEVPLTTIDKMVARLKAGRVDFIKMDIEGAEREAIQGCGRHHPPVSPALHAGQLLSPG